MPRFSCTLIPYVAALVAASILLVSCGGEQRPPTSTKTCLVLSVGAGHGLAHLGAIEVLKEEQVHIDCVVGNSMGSLVGALYAAEPARNTTESTKALLASYVEKTKEEAGARGAFGAILGFLVAGPVGAAVGGAGGAVTVDKLDRDRLIAVLDTHLANAQMDTMPVPFVTSYLEKQDDKVALVEPREGSVADAVGGSVANPYIFSNYDVRDGGPVDPGVDRMAAVPVEQACRYFPRAHIIALNVTPNAAVAPLGFDCTVDEIMIDVTGIDPGKPLADPAAMDEVIERGRAAMRSWLDSAR